MHNNVPWWKLRLCPSAIALWLLFSAALSLFHQGSIRKPCHVSETWLQPCLKRHFLPLLAADHRETAPCPERCANSSELLGSCMMFMWKTLNLIPEDLSPESQQNMPWLAQLCTSIDRIPYFHLSTPDQLDPFAFRDSGVGELCLSPAMIWYGAWFLSRCSDLGLVSHALSGDVARKSFLSSFVVSPEDWAH